MLIVKRGKIMLTRNSGILREIKSSNMVIKLIKFITNCSAIVLVKKNYPLNRISNSCQELTVVPDKNAY